MSLKRVRGRSGLGKGNMIQSMLLPPKPTPRTAPGSFHDPPPNCPQPTPAATLLAPMQPGWALGKDTEFPAIYAIAPEQPDSGTPFAVP